nr:MAG TPA: vesicle-associated membrane protein 2 [Caudoviricetes sp.]
MSSQGGFKNEKKKINRRICNYNYIVFNCKIYLILVLFLVLFLSNIVIFLMSFIYQINSKRLTKCVDL